MELRRSVDANTPPRETVIDGAVGFALSLLEPAKDGFRFTVESSQRDVYSTAYGVAILGLANRMNELDEEASRRIGDFLVNSQNEDGLFRDAHLTSPGAETGHGWGWHHLLPHVLIACEYLGLRPARPFAYLSEFFSDPSYQTHVDEMFSSDPLTASNFFLNMVVGMQYARDFMAADGFAGVIQEMLDKAALEIIPACVAATRERSRASVSHAVKTVYHLLPPLLYDRRTSPTFGGSVVRLALATEHDVSGFGVDCTGDACEDMDSVYTLATLSGSDPDGRQQAVLRRALCGLIVNRNVDGGFVFKRFQPFMYGQCEKLSSKRDQSNLFATWFRLLSYAFADSVVDVGGYPWRFASVPGYQYLPLADSDTENA